MLTHISMCSLPNYTPTHTNTQTPTHNLCIYPRFNNIKFNLFPEQKHSCVVFNVIKYTAVTHLGLLELT